ncbi:MAG TPA: LysR family transcriptional regulator [Longimicrobium sp.]|jgi:LysR family transcriptional activator of nhaA|uniref:LysR family transcriptional regulator n=1 Tax=Longimicrobium sp. TaxID=2029185 RepID=UPI002EDAC9D6
MPSLNYQHLYYFWVVAREGSIAAATHKLFVGQPTISAQIHALEQALGEKLFVRRGRGLALTETGQVAARFADEIFALGTEFMQTVKGQATGSPDRFAVGISDALPKLTTIRMLQPALSSGAYRLVFRIGKTEALLTDLAVHSLDLVLADAPAPASGKVRAFNHPLGRSEVSVFATQALAAEYGPGFPRSLDGAPFLLQTENTALRRSLDVWFAAEGIVPRIVAEVEDSALLQVLGQQGLGLFAAPSVVEAEVSHAYGVRVLGRLPHAYEHFYAISVERRLRHPAVIAISETARTELFSPEE